MQPGFVSKLVLFSGLFWVTVDVQAPAPPAELARHIESLLDPAAHARGRFSFGVLSDPHIHYSEYGWQDVSLRANLDRLKRAGADFIVITGDLGTYDTLRADGRSFTRQPDKFVEVLRSLPGCPPVLTSMGNHETDGEGKRAWLDALYPGVARNLTGNGNDRVLYYSFNYKNAHFVCLDSNRTVAGKMVWATLPEEELGWLDEDLRAHRNMPSFVFLHEPIKPHPDKPAHLLQNRGRLIHVLKSHPRAKWIFNGHDHYASHGRAWDLDISHVDRTATNVDGTAGLVVRVDGERVTVNKFDTTGTLTSVTNDYDLDGLFASRLQREGARAVYRIAEASLDMARGDPLRDAVSLIGPAAAVQPTQGISMIQVDRAPPKSQGEPPRDLYAWISTDVVGIRKGMKFTYDVRIDPDSVSDRLALILDLDLPAGVKPAELRDQNGISLGFIDAAGGGLQLPSLGERARGKWYRREFDLSHLTGGWIVSLRLFAGLPKSDGPAEGRLKFYLDNIHFTWSDR